MKFSLLATLVGVLALSLFADLLTDAATRLTKKERQARRRNRNRDRGNRRTTTAVPRSCPPIPHVSNGQGMDSGNTISYACEPGFVLEGTNVITCLDGRWTVAPRCRRQICPAPLTIPFANEPTVTESGTVAMYFCQAGYRIMNGGGVTSRTIRCNVPTMSWPVIACEQIPAVVCGAPPVVANAQSTLGSSGTTATYTCNTGYVLRSGTPATRQCTNGVWSTVNVPVCDRSAIVPPAPVTSCNKPPACGDANIVREDVSDSYEIGGMVKYTCTSGYRIVGADNSNTTGAAFCLSDGTFSTIPTCEKVDCGTPPVGTGTQAVVPTSTRFGAKITYVCNTNYEATAENLMSECMADGKWSKATVTCTQIMCKKDLLTAIATTIGNGVNVNYAPVDVAVAATFAFNCPVNYRIAPATTTTTTTTITVTCQADGTFTTPTLGCVYQYPESCKDYFRRDNIFAGTTIGACVEGIVIDPQGPVISTTNPGPTTVRCCKKSATQVCTQVLPTAGESFSNAAITAATGVGTPVTSCSTASSTVMGSTDFTASTSAAPATTGSGVCPGTLRTVEYPLTPAEIKSMVESTCGECKQITTIDCTAAARGLALALQTQTEEASGFLYGSAVFVTRPTNIDLSHYTYAHRKCDCASDPTVITAASSATDSCVGGCKCTKSVGATATADTITKYLTPDNLDYVTRYELTQHNTLAVSDAGSFSVTVGAIECCDTF